jgi:DNA-binding transcriptional LysR family regulator
MKAHPNINFVIDLDFDETDFEKYDIVFYPESPEKFSEWENFVYKQYQVKVEVTEESPLSERKLTLLSLKNQPFVSTGRTNPIYKTFISACERQGFTPNFVLECNDYTCIDRALRANVGLGVTLSTEASMGSTGMRHLNIVDFNERLNFCIYYKKTYGEIEKIVEYLKTGTV